MSKHDKQYLELLKKVLETGIIKDNRTDKKTISLFNQRLEFDLSEGFPIYHSKKVLYEKAFKEMLWFLSGSTNIKDLPSDTVNIWKDWANKDGEIGKGYGRQFRNIESFFIQSNLPIALMKKLNYNNISITQEGTHKISPYEKIKIEFLSNAGWTYTYSVDQLLKVEHTLKNNPNDRRIIIDLWNVNEIDEMNLPPCHLLTIFNVENGKLNTQLTMRSNDLFLGNPFNVCGYAMLTHLLASTTNLEVGKLAINITDAHIYENHVEQVKEQIKFLESNKEYDKVDFIIQNSQKSIVNYKIEDFCLLNYKSEKFLKGKVAI